MARCMYVHAHTYVHTNTHSHTHIHNVLLIYHVLHAIESYDGLLCFRLRTQKSVRMVYIYSVAKK